MQKIGGFLAILNVTGGTFSPHPQKLPFSVTSVDGDNCLLYYSSVNLAGNSPAKKVRGPKMKRSFSSGDSLAEKSRLRVPMKGRIQLVCFSHYLAICSCLFELATSPIYIAYDRSSVIRKRLPYILSFAIMI